MLCFLLQGTGKEKRFTDAAHTDEVHKPFYQFFPTDTVRTNSCQGLVLKMYVTYMHVHVSTNLLHLDKQYPRQTSEGIAVITAGEENCYKEGSVQYHKKTSFGGKKIALAHLEIIFCWPCNSW